MTSIRTRLTLIFIGLAIIPPLVMGMILGYQSFNVQQQQALSLEQQVAKRIGTAVAAYLQGLEDELRIVVEVQGLHDLSPVQQGAILHELLLHQAAFEEITLLDSNGSEQ